MMAMTLSTALVERTSSFLGSRLSRRGFINRSAFAGSAVAIGAGVDLALKPGTAYGAICSCGSSALRVRHDLLLGVHRFLLLGERWLQLLPDQHGDGRLVEGGQLVLLWRSALLHGLQRHLPVHDRLRERIPFLRHAM